MKPDSIEVKVQEIRDNIAIVRDSAGKTIEIPDRYYEEGETLVLSQAQLKAIEEGLDPYDTDAAVPPSARGKGILAAVLILLALAAALAGIYFLRLNGNSRQTSRGGSTAQSNQGTATSLESAEILSAAEDERSTEADRISEDITVPNQDSEVASSEDAVDTTLEEEEIVSQDEEAASEADSKEDDEEARAAEEEREKREREELEQRAAAERERRAQAEREEQARLAAEAAAAEAEARAAADAYYNEIAAQIAGQSGHDAAGTLAGLSQSDALEVIRRLPTEKVAEIQEASAKAAEKAAQEAAEAAAQDAEALAQQ